MKWIISFFSFCNIFFINDFSFSIFKAKKNFFIFYLPIFVCVKYDNHMAPIFIVLMIHLSWKSECYDFKVILPLFFWIIVSFDSLRFYHL
jgi:hypothetical protein